MSFGLSLGLFYDDGQLQSRSAWMLQAGVHRSTAAVGHVRMVASLPEHAAVVATTAPPLLFLTYDLHGQPATFFVEQGRISLFA